MQQKETLQQSLKADSAFFSYFNRESKVRKEKFAAGRRLSRKVLDFQSLDKKTFTLCIISDAINYKVGDLIQKCRCFKGQKCVKNNV